MASPPSAPPSVLLRLRAPPCSRRALLLRQNLHPYPSPRTGRRPVAAAAVEQLAPRLPGTGRSSFEFACRCSYDPRNEPPAPPPDKEQSLDEWPAIRRWDVPCEWPTVSLTMVACAVSFLLTGMVEQSVLEYLGFQAEEATIDEKAEVLFFRQFSVTAVVIGVIFGITNAFRPFSDDIFRYDRLTSPSIATDWLIEYQHCLFAGHHWGSGINSGGNCVLRISNGVLDYVVFYSNFCAYHCCSVCLRSSYTRRIPTAVCACCRDTISRSCCRHLEGFTWSA